MQQQQANAFMHLNHNLQDNSNNNTNNNNNTNRNNPNMNASSDEGLPFLDQLDQVFREGYIANAQYRTNVRGQGLHELQQSQSQQPQQQPPRQQPSPLHQQQQQQQHQQQYRPYLYQNQQQHKQSQQLEDQNRSQPSMLTSHPRPTNPQATNPNNANNEMYKSSMFMDIDYSRLMKHPDDASVPSSQPLSSSVNPSHQQRQPLQHSASAGDPIHDNPRTGNHAMSLVIDKRSPAHALNASTASGSRLISRNLQHPPNMLADLQHEHSGRDPSPESIPIRAMSEPTTSPMTMPLASAKTELGTVTGLIPPASLSSCSPGMTQREFMLMRRKLRNRASAKRSRLKREKEIQDLEMNYQLREKEIYKLKQENMKLRVQNERLNIELMVLQRNKQGGQPGASDIHALMDQDDTNLRENVG